MGLRQDGRGCGSRRGGGGRWGFGSSVLHLFVSSQDRHKSGSYLKQHMGLWFGLNPNSFPVLWQCMGVELLVPQCTGKSFFWTFIMRNSFCPDQSFSPSSQFCSSLNRVTAAEAAAACLARYRSTSNASNNLMLALDCLLLFIWRLFKNKLNSPSKCGAVFPVSLLCSCWSPPCRPASNRSSLCVPDSVKHDDTFSTHTSVYKLNCEITVADTVSVFHTVCSLMALH